MRRLDADVKPRGKEEEEEEEEEEEVQISISFLLTRQPHVRKERYIITAPRLYGFHLVVMEEGDRGESPACFVALSLRAHL